VEILSKDSGRRLARSFSRSAAAERLVNAIFVVIISELFQRFAAEQIDAPQAVLHMPDKAQPRRAIAPCFGSIVLREHAADGVFVDIDAKGTRNLLCDAGTANTGIAALELDDCVNEFLRWPLGPGRR
jgi:hypothetical protein